MLQENGDNIPAQDVTGDVNDDVKFADGNDKTYTVYLIQVTVGQKHSMEFNQVAKFLQEIEAKVRETAQEGQTNGTEILKNSLLGGKVSVALCYLEPSV